MKFAAFLFDLFDQKINKNHKRTRSIDFSKHHTKPPWSLKWLEGNYFRARGKKYAIKSHFVNHESVSKVFEDYQNSDLYFNTGIFGIACVISSKFRLYWRYHNTNKNCRQVLFLYAVTICYDCVTLCVINHFQKSMPNSTGAICKSVLFMTDQSDSKNDNDFQVCPSDCLDSILFMIYIFWKIDTGMHKISFYRGALALFTMAFEDGH